MVSVVKMILQLPSMITWNEVYTRRYTFNEMVAISETDTHNDARMVR